MMWTITAVVVAVRYWIRSLFLRPAPEWQRCIVGSRLHPLLWCPRRSMRGTFVCRNHGVH